LALLSALAVRWRLAALALAAYVGFYFLEWWLFTHRIDRFLVPALPALAVMAGIGAVWTRVVVWQWTLRGLLVLGLAANFVTVTCGLGADNRYFASYARLRYDPNTTDFWHGWLKENVPPGKRALLVGDAQPFNLEAPALYSTTFDISPFANWLYGKTADEALQKLNEERISHVYVRWDEIKRYRSPGNYGFADFINLSLFQELIDRGVLDNPIFIPSDPLRMVYPVRPLPTHSDASPEAKAPLGAEAKAAESGSAPALSPTDGAPPATQPANR